MIVTEFTFGAFNCFTAKYFLTNSPLREEEENYISLLQYDSYLKIYATLNFWFTRKFHQMAAETHLCLQTPS